MDRRREPWRERRDGDAPDGSPVLALEIPLADVKMLAPLDAVRLVPPLPLNCSRRFLALETSRMDMSYGVETTVCEGKRAVGREGGGPRIAKSEASGWYLY